MEYLVALRIPCPTAGVCQPLRFGQIGFAAPKGLFRPLALGNVAHQAQKPKSALLQVAEANFYGERGAVLALVASLEGERFPSGDALPRALDGRLVETNVENASMTADQFFSVIAQALAGLAVDIENGRMIVKQEKSVGRVVHEGAEARLARSQLFLRLLALGNVARQARIRRPPFSK